MIKDWKDIAGKPVCAKQGVAYNKLVETQYKSPLTAFTGNTEGKEAVRSGKCVAWLYDDVSILAAPRGTGMGRLRNARAGPVRQSVGRGGSNRGAQ